MRKLLVFLPLLAGTLAAQDVIPEERGAAGLYHSLTTLKTTLRGMHIAAHPDDEDGAAIALLARGHGVDMTMLILNRGESGANLVTNDFFDALGALRTVEVLRSAQYYGASKVRFTRFIDYGYSKNVAETFRQWNRQEALKEVVRAIRAERPHLILSRWSGTPRDGHGNHEASGILAQEAFDAAGDPARFPELKQEGLEPWKPLKLYVGNRNALDENSLKVPTGVRDPILGITYAQLARQGLRFQRSQGTGSAIPRPGPFFSYYKLASTANAAAGKEQGVLDGLDSSLASLGEVKTHIDAAGRNFNPTQPSAIASHIASALKAARAAPPTTEMTLKISQLEKALTQSLGIEIEARVDPRNPAAGPFASFRPGETFRVAVPGQTFKASVRVFGVQPAKIELLADPSWRISSTEPGKFEVKVPEKAPYTRAFWRRDSVRQTRYDIDDPALAGTPKPPCPLRARVHFKHDGVDAAIEAPVKTSSIDATSIEHLQELAVGPPIALEFATEAGILPLASGAHPLEVKVSSNVDGPASGAVRLLLPSGWKSEPSEQLYTFQREKEEATFAFRLVAPPGLEPSEIAVKATAVYQGKEYGATFQAVTYPGLDTIYLSKPAVHVVRAIDVKVRDGLRIGYIMGSGDDVPEALRQLQVPFELIAPSADFSKFTTILLGIRAYAARPDLAVNNGKLLEFVKAGGTVIVQYNTPEFDRNFGPWPYSMGRNPEEVSEEDSPVRILVPSHPVFAQPNKITDADFAGWIEQRGSKFFSLWDDRYNPLIEMHDTGQDPQKGIWVETQYGKGKWIYCALAWYRQLPYAVPGATRLFANLISQ